MHSDETGSDPRTHVPDGDDSIAAGETPEIGVDAPCVPGQQENEGEEAEEKKVTLSPHSSPAWQRFGIWGAGRDGKQFYKALSPAQRTRVTCFYDIDPRKIGKQYVDMETSPARHIDILPLTAMTPPLVVCVALSRDNGMEEKLADSGLVEGVHYYCMV
jgi:hypothetical protein